MALNLDVSKLTQSAAAKATPHDNCVVLDLGAGSFPRDIEVRLPDDDGARQNALWDGSLNLSVNDEVLCFEYSGLSAWRVMGMGGNDGGAGKVRVSEVWESDFGAVALQSDADANIGIGTAGPDAKLDVLTTAGAQLRLTFENEVKFTDFAVDANHNLAIDPTSTGEIKLNATVTVLDEIQRKGDADTKIGFADDKFSLTVGGLLMFEAVEIAGQDTLDLGDAGGGGDVDIDFNDGQMFLQGSSGNLHIGGTDPDSLLVVNGETFIGPPAASGNTSNGKVTIGLTLNQEANDDSILELKSSDIAHGMTDQTETDTYFFIRKSVGSDGGATMIGLGEGTVGFLNAGIAVNDVTTKSAAAAAGYIEFRALKKSGTGAASVGADANLLTIRNNTQARFIFDAEGTGHADDSWITFSDRRLKTEIENIPYGLSELMLLRPKRFVKRSGAFNDDGKVELSGKGRRKIGLIAQDVRSIIPEAVKDIDSEATSFYSLDYDSLSALLISAVQELKLEVDELRHTYGIN